ncbi:flotillin family protein [Tenuibacillus multivorans]|uniref:Flotillin n=1 Tax=Tenuibacillus multivorans TaxID=237069 RepID=A0A1H0AVS0_9BACI|nr:flotillin family protein [Tenuibacillus multivorans]GEL77799.1 flotillin [Tenuibacillus multivorans]SDN37455.1 flotillin [Tenuibacillus multivorans]
MGFLAFLAILIPVLIVAAIIGLIWWIWMKFRYKTAKSNEALIIAGPRLGNPEKETNIFTDDEGRSMKIIRGGGHLLKMHQTATPVDLNAFQLKLTTPKVYTKQGVPIVADAVAMVKVADTLKGIALYAEQFLGKKSKEQEAEISEVLNANLRAILSKMSVEQINEDREEFNRQVTEVAQKQLDEMGFKITSLGLQDLRDADEENGYLDNLGRPRIAEARKRAELAESDADKETRIHRANNDKEAKEEEFERQSEIAESKKTKDLNDAAIKEETERARAKSEQSYQLEKARLDKQVQEEKLKLVAQEKEEDLRLKHLERERLVKLEEEEAKVRKAKADADYYETTKIAEAEARKSQIDGETDARIKREQGLAEAEVIREKGEAEAEARRQLAEAIAEHGDVVIAEKLIEMLPDYAREISHPLSNIDSVKVIDSGSGNGINSYGQQVTNTMAQVQEPLKDLTGIDISKLLSDLANRGNTHTVIKEEASRSSMESEPDEFEEENTKKESNRNE